MKTISDALTRVYADKECADFLKTSLASDDSFVAAKDAPAFMQGEFEVVREVLVTAGTN